MSDTFNLWLSFAKKLENNAKNIFFETDVSFNGVSDPKAVGAMLFARSHLTIGSIIQLAESDKIVDARILLRSVVENFIWLSAIITRGDSFVKDMKSDEVQGRQGLYNIVINKIDGVDKEAVERLKGAKIFWDTHWPKSSLLKPSKVAKDNPVESISLLYKQLCITVSHPTITAISRHLVSDENEGRGIDLCPIINPAERLSTIVETCLVMLGVIVAFGQLTETKSGGTINALAGEYELLRTRTGVQ